MVKSGAVEQDFGGAGVVAGVVIGVVTGVVTSSGVGEVHRNVV